MEINCSLTLPRDARTVPVVRRLVRSAMEQLGVVTQDVSDVSLALTEACSNVIEHSSEDEDEYRVELTVNERRCHIRVLDMGRGFDAAGLETVGPMADVEAERGRGIRMMQALVDAAVFESQPERGTVVHLAKALRLQEGSLFRRLSERHEQGAAELPAGS